MKKILFILAVLLAFPIAAWAVPHTYYVAAAGTTPTPTDTGGIGTCNISSPCATFAYVAPFLVCGDTLYIRGGSYAQGFGFSYGSATIDTCSSWGSSILFAGYPGETVTLTNPSQESIIGLGTDQIYVYPTGYPLVRPIYWTFQNLILDGTGGAPGVGSGLTTAGVGYLRFLDIEYRFAERENIYIGQGDYIEFTGGSSHDGSTCAVLIVVPENCKIANRAAYAHGLYITAAHTTVDGMHLYHNPGCGMQFQQSEGATPNYGILRNSVINDNSFGGPEDPGTGYCEGVSIAGNATGIQVYNNFIYENFQKGLALGGSSTCTDCEIYNNTIVANFGVGIYMRSVVRGIVKNNIVWANRGYEIEFDGSNNAGASVALTTNMIRVGQDVYDSGNGMSGTITEIGTIHADPLFPSFPTNIYPAAPSVIAAGVDLSAIFTTDRHGMTRAAGAFDIGSEAVSVGSCTPTHLAFTSQPSNAVVAATLGTVSVALKNAGGGTCTGSSATITLAKTAGTCTGMTLGGTVSGATSGGVFTSTNITLSAAGNCSLTATSSVTSAVSNTFTISTSCTPHHLTFTAQPHSTAIGGNIGPVTVEVQNSSGSRCTGATTTVTLSAHSGVCIGMTFGGTVSGASVAGIFTTTNITSDAAGACSLDATAAITGAQSDSFTVSTIIISVVLPDRYRQGTHDWITVVGEGTAWDGTTVCAAGADIIVTVLTIVGPALAACFLEIDANAALGPRTITMTTGMDVALSNAFLVTGSQVNPRMLRH